MDDHRRLLFSSAPSASASSSTARVAARSPSLNAPRLPSASAMSTSAADHFGLDDARGEERRPGLAPGGILEERRAPKKSSLRRSSGASSSRNRAQAAAVDVLASFHAREEVKRPRRRFLRVLIPICICIPRRRRRGVHSPLRVVVGRRGVGDGRARRQRRRRRLACQTSRGPVDARTRGVQDALDHGRRLDVVNDDRKQGRR
eukprot:31349-Pelagococcus_subviridis.AAC.5